jgi:dipeptidyl-peptidase-3
MTVHTIPIETSVVNLDATKAFEGLTAAERQYAHALARADWEGAKICLLQTSPESAPIFALLQLVFSAQPVADLLASARAKGMSDDEIEKAMCYCAAFYGNVGNYKSFGDTKFVPALPPARFETLLLAGAADADKVRELWSECRVRMYSLPPRQRQLGLGADAGIST